MNVQQQRRNPHDAKPAHGVVMRSQASALNSYRAGKRFQFISIAQAVACLSPNWSTVRRNMNVSTKQAFSIFEDWKTKKSALLITGPITLPTPDGISTGMAKLSARIFRVDSISEQVCVAAISGEQEIVFDLAGASFAIAPNSADPDGESLVVTARLKERGMLFFVEDFSRIKKPASQAG